MISSNSNKNETNKKYFKNERVGGGGSASIEEEEASFSLSSELSSRFFS